MKFSELPLHPALLDAVAAQGYETPTPIQRDAIPPILLGRNLVGCAQTGTGKTAAFALPTIQRLMESITQSKSHPAPSPSEGRAGEGGEAGTRNAPSGRQARSSRRKTRTLVLAPTRELCSQIADSFAAYGQNTPLRYTVIFGGVSQQSQVRALQHGVDVIIATPGRLLDLMEQGHVDLGHVEILILDEADRMLDMGFLPDIRRIVARVPRKRQTLMFSATMPPEIRQLASQWLVDPVSVAVTPVASTAERIEQAVYFVEKRSKARLLKAWIERTPSTRTLVFARTKHGADKIVKELLKSRIFAAAIHGNKSQSQRERALAQFKSTRPPVLVATDIAARGIDVTGISHVVNYDLPAEPETYVHRIGRTGRAGADGVAVSFCSVEEVGLLRSIERLTRRRIDAAADHGQYEMAGQIAPAPSSPARSNGRGRANGQRNGAGKRRPAARRPSGPLPSEGRVREGGSQGTRTDRTNHAERKPKHEPQSQQTQTTARPKRRRRRSTGAGPNNNRHTPR